MGFIPHVNVAMRGFVHPSKKGIYQHGGGKRSFHDLQKQQKLDGVMHL